MAIPQPCQVLVVGAGAAGALAAIAAARSGAETVLLDQDGWPGGLGRTQLHRHICGWFAGGAEEPGPIIHGPLVQELCARLGRRTPSTRPVRMGRVWVWPLEVGQWSEALSDWLRETRSLRLLLRQRVTAFVPTGDGAGLVRTTGDAGELELGVRVIVDASGSAAVAALAGWELVQTNAADRQLAGCTLRLTGVDTGDALLPYRVPDCLRRAAERGYFPALVRHATFIPGGGDSSLLRLNIPAETPQRRVAELAHAALAELRERCEAFRGATLHETCELQPRDGPRVRGRYLLTGEDIVTARRFDDAVARGAWPSERWSWDRGPRYRYVPAGACYDIPLRSLLSPRSDRVLFAGRSLSADDEAAASVRVMGICMATGEAAGLEAAKRALY